MPGGAVCQGSSGCLCHCSSTALTSRHLREPAEMIHIEQLDATRTASPRARAAANENSTVEGELCNGAGLGPGGWHVVRQKVMEPLFLHPMILTALMRQNRVDFEVRAMKHETRNTKHIAFIPDRALWRVNGHPQAPRWLMRDSASPGQSLVMYSYIAYLLDPRLCIE